MKTSSQKHAQLKSLSKDAKSNLYQMIALADDLLQDHEYVDSLGGEGKFLEDLQDNEFSHFGGDPDVAEMLFAYRANREERVWKKYNYNIRALIEIAQPDKSERAEVRHTNWKQIAAELQLKLEQLQRQLADQQILLDKARVDRDEAIKAASRLEGRLEELERRQLV